MDVSEHERLSRYVENVYKFLQNNTNNQSISSYYISDCLCII